ncbi:MAG: phage major capsid protein [Desulfobulbaceae bacterium]|nr:phage major capsid protein [Desulfobulbaceae bacterium]
MDETQKTKCRFRLDRKKINIETRTVRATLSTEFPVDRYDGQEVLVHRHEAIDLSRSPVPLLCSHNDKDLPIGVVENITLKDSTLKGDLRVSKGARADEIWQDIVDGVLQHVSVSYQVLKRTFEGNIMRVARWQLLEVSLVAIPADPNAKIGRSYQKKNDRRGKDIMNKDQKLLKLYRSICSLISKDENETITDEEKLQLHEKQRAFDELAPAVFGDDLVTFRDNGQVAVEKRMNATTNGPVPFADSIGDEDGDSETIETRGGPCGKDRSYRAMFYLGESRDLDRGGFKNGEEFLNVIHSSRYDDRLTRASMVESVATEGGFSVPEEFAAEWLDSSLENEIVRPRAQVWPMSSLTRHVPGWDGNDRSGGTTHGGFEMQWLAEQGTGTRQTAKMRKIELKAQKGAIYCQVSNELAADGLGFEDQLKNALVSSVGFGLDDKFFFGSGAGCPQGALSSSNPSLITVAKETGQLGSTITYGNLAQMFARVAPRCLKNATWHANMTAIPQLLQLSIPVGTGGSHVPVLKESNGKFYIFGVEVIFTEHMKSLGTVGDIALIDWTQYAVGLRKEVAIDKSNAPGWMEDMTDYRVIVRVDGQGTWNKAITPKNGDTLSWAVTLAERS